MIEALNMPVILLALANGIRQWRSRTVRRPSIQCSATAPEMASASRMAGIVSASIMGRVPSFPLVGLGGASG